MLKKLRIFFNFLGIMLLLSVFWADEWNSFDDRFAYAFLAICILVICNPALFTRFLKWILKSIRYIFIKICKLTTAASNTTVQHSEKQGPDRIITTQDDLENFMQQYTVIDEIRTKVVGVTFRNDDGSNRQSILAHCHTGDDILLRYFEYHRTPAYGVLTEHGQIGNLSKELAWELGQYGDDIYVVGKILAVTGGDRGKSFGCNIALTIYGPK